MTSTLPIILASSSPQRQSLMRDAGYEFTVVSPLLEEPEDLFHKLPAVQQAEALSYFKARTVADTHPHQTVLGADTIVAVSEQVLGKPADEADARRMLQTLGGTRHRVITGVTLIGPGAERLIASDVTFVTMRQMTPRELDDYIASREWEGKAGAYAIQETADRFVTKIEGSWSNIVGLPMELVVKMIEELVSRPQRHRVL